jgi:tripartite-type tricarboxylate transporter receptor subunit TctC
MIMGPANMPKDILTRLNTEANKALQSAAVRDQLTKLSFGVVGGTPEEADAFVRAESKKWGEVIAKAGLKAQ